MNIIQLLKQDHKEIEYMLIQLNNTSDEAIQLLETIFVKLYTALIIHMNFKEKLFYPTFQKQEIKKTIFQTCEEQKIIRKLLQDLKNLSKIDEIWKPKLKILTENFVYYTEQEENELFAIVNNFLEKNALEQLGKEYMSFKEECGIFYELLVLA